MRTAPDRELDREPSLEDPALGTTSSLPVAATRVPDGVARLRLPVRRLDVARRLALRDIAGLGARLGRAGILGATYEAEILGRPGSITGPDRRRRRCSALYRLATRRRSRSPGPARQRSDARLLGRLSRRIGNGPTKSRPISMSAATSSRCRSSTSKGKIRIDRVTANLVWTPVEGLKAGIEASIAWARLSLTGRADRGRAGGAADLDAGLHRAGVLKHRPKSDCGLQESRCKHRSLDHRAGYDIRSDDLRSYLLRSALSFSQYSSRFLISRSKPRSGGS